MPVFQDSSKFPNTDYVFYVIMGFIACVCLIQNDFLHHFSFVHKFLFLLLFPRNLQKLSLFGDISILQQHGTISNTYLGKVDPDGKKIKQ